MRIMILEADPSEREMISEMLDSQCDIHYEKTATKAINTLGMSHMDYVLVDADTTQKICNWNELTKFLTNLGIKYSIFSSNGKVGIKNGQEIFSINDLPDIVEARRKLAN